MKRFEAPEINIVKFLNEETVLTRSSSYTGGTEIDFPDDDIASESNVF